MRVLYLNPFSQQVSGPDESLLTLLGKLIPMGVEAHLVLPRNGPQVPRYQALGVKVHFAPLSVLKRRFGPVDLALFGPRLLRGAAAVTRIAGQEHIDLIHTNMEVVLDGAIAARRLRLPHVLHYRGNTLERPKLVFDALARLWTSTADKVFCISEATAQIFRKRGLGAKVEVLYNPVDVEMFASAERSDGVRRELGAGPGSFLAGTVARIHPRKDVATFLRAGALAMKELPSLRLVVVGTAEMPEERVYEAKLKNLARELGIEDRLCWAGARRDMPRVLKALDLFVLCSRNEGFGRVVAEAMAGGTPVVVTREGALPELVKAGELGLLAEPASPASFAEGLLRVAVDQGVRRALISASTREAERFAARSLANSWLESYAALVPACDPRRSMLHGV